MPIRGKAPHLNNVELGRHGRNRTNVWDYASVSRRRGGSRLTDREIAEIGRCTQDPESLEWARRTKP